MMEDPEERHSRWDQMPDQEEETKATDRVHGREEPNSGNPAPKQHQRVLDPEMIELFRLLQQEQRQQTQALLQSLQQLHTAKDEKLSRLIHRQPYRGTKWNSSEGDAKLAVQVVDFINDVERHARRSWKVNPVVPTEDPDGEILKAVEGSIGTIPRKVWYDKWIAMAERAGIPSWLDFKKAATKRFLETETYDVHQIYELLSMPQLETFKSAMEFNTEFRTRMGYIGAKYQFSDTQARGLYLSKINKTDREWLTMNKPTATLDEWMLLIERSRRDPGSRPRGKPKDQKPTGANKRHCFQCGDANHLAPHCKASQDKKDQHTANCVSCKKSREKRSAA